MVNFWQTFLFLLGLFASFASGYCSLPSPKDVQRLDKFVLFHIYRNALKERGSKAKRVDVFPSLAVHHAFQFAMAPGSDIPIYTVRSSSTNRSILAAHYRESGTRDLTADEITMFASFISPQPDDQETVLHLARMSSTAYEPWPRWYDDDPFHREKDFGWNDDGLRGYVYLNADQSILIMAIKGTSAALFGRNGTTVVHDKYMDNIMFSCCCARVDFTWTPVCGCYQTTNTCSQKCLIKAIKGLDSYLEAAKEIYRQLRGMYPRASIWFTGHSLGGSLASLLAMSFKGTTAFAYGAPGEQLYAQRLLLISSNDTHSDFTKSLLGEELAAALPIYHYYHTADPIPYGKCVGLFSACYYSGYALETQCHLGNVCIYDLGRAHYDINKHRINYMIDNVIDKAKAPPPCFPQRLCRDCPAWKFV